MRNDNILLALAGLRLSSAISIASTLSNGNEVYDGYVSFSIELAFFPDYAGTTSKPNTFSDNLLTNIGNIIGTKPYIRVGGNTQDFALYDGSQTAAVNGVYDPAVSTDYPSNVTLGPSFFDSYGAWSNTKYSHGFNMELAGTANGWQTLLDTVPLACKALSGGNLYYWEYGNEPNLFSSDLSDSEYVTNYKNGSSQIMDLVKEHCPDLASSSLLGFLAPSFSGVGGTLDPSTVFSDGFNSGGDIKLYSTHNYISGATSPGVTLQGTLMNHAETTNSVNAQITEYKAIASAPPLIFGETNSLYNEGAPGLSNTFGAALWGVDFNLYSASVGFKRVHMHQGTDYRYASWQPITTSKTAIGTKAPYYGNIAVAAMLGNLIKDPAAIASIDLGAGDQASAYAAYTNSGKTLARVMVLNLNAYNSTVDGEGVVPLSNPPARASSKYTFTIGGLKQGTKVSLQRLLADGSDAISGISWDGFSYNYELSKGQPVRLTNVTNGETVTAGDGGVINVDVPDSSAVMLDFVASSGSQSPSNVGLPKGSQATASAGAASQTQTSGARRGMNIMGWEL